MLWRASQNSVPFAQGTLTPAGGERLSFCQACPRLMIILGAHRDQGSAYAGYAALTAVARRVRHSDAGWA
jgi:hypothetical protein